MIKRVFLFLAVIATLLQWSYAIAGQYCAHESGPPQPPVAEQPIKSPAHWGHHFHHHSADVSAADPAKSKSQQSHNDCNFCHAGTGSIASAAFELPHHVRETSLNTVPPTVLQSLPPDAPERPNWRA